MHILVQGCYWNAAPVQHWCSPCIAFWLRPIEQAGSGHWLPEDTKDTVHSGAAPSLFAMSALRGLRPLHLFLHVFRFGPIGCYSSSVCANDTKISKSSWRHGAIPASKFSSHIKSQAALLKSLPSCSREHILSMFVKPPRTWGPYGFEATPPTDCMTTKENRQYIVAWRSLICYDV